MEASVRQSSSETTPWTIWWVGELSGPSASRADEESCAVLAPRVIGGADDVAGFIAELRPSTRIRVEDLTVPDDMVDVVARFGSISDFDDDGLEARVAAIARAAQRDARPSDEQDGPAASGLARLIDAALRGDGGRSGGPSSSGPASGAPSVGLRSRQLALVRDDEPLRRLERSWRSLQRLAVAAEAAGAKVHALDVSDAGLRGACGRLGRGDDAPLARRLDELAADPARRPELVVVELDVPLDVDGVGILRGLATLAAQLGAPVIVGGAHDWLGDADSAVAVDRAARDLTLAPFRTLREHPAAALLTVALPSVGRERAALDARPRPTSTDASQRCWIQGGGSAIAEAVVHAIAKGGPAAGSPLMAGPGTIATRLRATSVAHLGQLGFAGLGSEDGVAAFSVRTGPVVATVRAAPPGLDPRASDLRVRMACARLSKAITLATRRHGAPSNDAVSLERLCGLLTSEAASLDLRIAVPEAVGPVISIAARYDSHDERSLCLIVDLGECTLAGGSPFARVMVYPLASTSLDR